MTPMLIADTTGDLHPVSTIERLRPLKDRKYRVKCSDGAGFDALSEDVGDLLSTILPNAAFPGAVVVEFVTDDGNPYFEFGLIVGWRVSGDVAAPVTTAGAILSPTWAVWDGTADRVFLRGTELFDGGLEQWKAAVLHDHQQSQRRAG